MISKTARIASLAILAAMIGLSPGAARAADAVHLSQLTIRLWPEFDRPGVLVFLIGQTASGTTLPAELKFSLPPGSTVNAVAYFDKANNILSDKVPQTIDGTNVTITTPNGNFHIEFYDPALRSNNRLRSYSFTWQGDFNIDALTWEVEQPPGATAFQVDPPGGVLITDENRLPAYQLKTTAPLPGQGATVSLGYQKPDDTLTINALAASRSAGASAAQPPTGGGDTLTIAIAVAIVVLVIAGIAIFALRGGFAGIGLPVGAAESRQPLSGKTRRKAGGKRAKERASGQRFCPQCGQAARPDDRFCRNCGTKLRA